MPLPNFVEYDPDCYTPLLTLEECTNPRVKIALHNAIQSWDVEHSGLLDRLTDLNKNYLGRYFDPEMGFINPLTGKFQEAFVDMHPLELAPVEWWRDNFSRRRMQVEVVRVRVEAIKRWRAIGSIFRAWFPAEFHKLLIDQANDNRPPHE